MTNIRLLKAEIIRNGLTRIKVAEYLGISLTALQNKLSNKVEFRASEIYTLYKILNLSKETFMEIFFADSVDLQ